MLNMNMANMKGFLIAVVLYALCVITFASEDSCHSYAGGQVYPQETRRTSGHTIQWSQAVSKFICIMCESGIPRSPVAGKSVNQG